MEAITKNHIQIQVGWCFEPPGLVEGVFVCGGGFETG